MSGILERIISYILGGLLGTAVGLTIVSFKIPMFEQAGLSTVLVAITTIIGLLTSIIIIETRAERVMKHNNAIRDETVALITHEMRTALTSTGWAIDMVLKKYADKLSEDDKVMLKDSTGSIHQTVMHSVNLLDISLLDIGKLNISLEWTTLDKVEHMFHEVIEKYTLGSIKNGVKLIGTATLDHERKAEVDMMRLRIVLENLIENALQYIGNGKKEITVTITNDAKNMKMVVKDTGIGIPAKEKDKIFSEFYRASNARKALGSGSGIGLYTCCRYIKAHRGTLAFESKEGEGTTFFATVPLNTVADVDGFLKKI
jgi:two-component system phosphate regulon sensor histidine kinase PhoR